MSVCNVVLFLIVCLLFYFEITNTTATRPLTNLSGRI